MNHIMKLSRQKKKDSILVIKDQTSEVIYLKTITEKKKTKEVWKDC